MNPIQRRGSETGAVLATFTIGLLGLLLFFGLAIDVGLLYMSRAALSKGADAAALMGARNLGQGEAVAARIAGGAFAMNYAASGLATRQIDVPSVTVSFSTDAALNKLVTVHAIVRFHTFFLRLLPQFATMDVASSAQSMRSKLVMSVVLDRSGSMLGNGGAIALPPAAGTFIDFFDDVNDSVALASFADYASLDVSIRHGFKAPIHSRLKTMSFGGWTFSHGGIDIGSQQIAKVPVVAGDSVARVLVFFTDGQANSFVDTVNCTGTAISLVLVPGSGRSDFRNPANGAAVTCNATTTTTFFSRKYRQNRTRNTANVTEEGLYRAEQSALAARQAGTVIYAIGLGNAIDKNTLRASANDPASPTFDPRQPQGEAVFAPTAADLSEVFDQIAAKILLRLTQ